MYDRLKEIYENILKVVYKTKEIEFIKFLAKKYFNTEDVYIFGSRVDDNKKGGDIDIYFETNLQNTLKAKLKFLTEFELKFDLKKLI